MNVFSVAALAALSAGSVCAQDATYRSALDTYQPFKDAELAPWKDANDTVRQIGGWRAYAREAAQGAAAPAAAPANAAPAVGASRPAAPAPSPAPPPAPAPAPAPGAGAHKH